MTGVGSMDPESVAPEAISTSRISDPVDTEETDHDSVDHDDTSGRRIFPISVVGDSTSDDATEFSILTTPIVSETTGSVSSAKRSDDGMRVDMNAVRTISAIKTR